jgi:hypothetical protein
MTKMSVTIHRSKEQDQSQGQPKYAFHFHILPGKIFLIPGAFTNVVKIRTFLEVSTGPGDATICTFRLTNFAIVGLSHIFSANNSQLSDIIYENDFLWKIFLYFSALTTLPSLEVMAMTQGIGEAAALLSCTSLTNGGLTSWVLFGYIIGYEKVGGVTMRHVQCYTQNSDFECFLLK